MTWAQAEEVPLNIDRMPTGAAPEQERNKACPRETEVQKLCLWNPIVWGACRVSPGSVTNG